MQCMKYKLGIFVTRPLQLSDRCRIHHRNTSLYWMWHRIKESLKLPCHVNNYTTHQPQSEPVFTHYETNIHMYNLT